MKKPNISKVKVFGIPLNKKTAVRWKIYLDRAGMYLGYINFVMIAFVFLNSIKDQGIRTFMDDNKLLVYPAIVVIFIGISLVLGRFDTKFGLRKEEMRNNATENPVMNEILESLEEIKSKMDNRKLEDRG